MAKTDFNPEQQRAIDESSSVDLVITAGAGSGKTKVLSERVYRLIEKGEVAPESLLVLTFTNNASYEMKTRILDRFGKDHPLYPRMQSCHVQSFDSFRAYLVRAYAQELKVPKTFVLMPESIESEKRSHFVEEVVQECYLDPEKREELIGFLTKFGFKNLEKVDECVLYLSNRLSALAPQEREDYFASYGPRFFDQAGLKKVYVEAVEETFADIRAALRQAAFMEIQYMAIAPALEKDDYATVARAFSMASDWERDLSTIAFQTTENAIWDFLPGFYRDLLKFLETDVMDASSAAASFLDLHANEYHRSVRNDIKLDAEDQARLSAVCSYLRSTEKMLGELVALGDFESAKSQALWCEKEERFLLGLAKEVSRRLSEYKKSVNAFSFDDIGFLAIKLFQDPALEKCAKEIAERFDYVMVDEYQDNNDGQEALLTGLSQLRDDGSRAHLFCVGDAKQAIYAFRGSNVDLIRNRAKKYALSSDGRVIPMNKNYRSAKRLLSDINYIFSAYMRMDNGGIDYLDPAERLAYDDSVNLYKDDAGNYGVRRITPPDAFGLQNKRVALEKTEPAVYEAMAILNDIQRKVAEGHLIFDRSQKKLRPCDYGDFAILVRRKKQVLLYSNLFAANGVPLNNQLSVDLREVSPTILLRSILGLLANRIYGENRDETYLFASIARSYAFHYDDTRVHRILTGADVEGEYTSEEKVSMAIHADPILKKIDSFADAHRDSDFETILLDLVDEFGILSQLPRLGDVEAYVSKIESLFAMALSEKDLGVGLSDFIAFFDSLEEYEIELKSETVSETKQAVDLMTIHASKGLERKIVYMPSSESGMGKGDARTEPPFFFSFDQGICFPYLGYEIGDDISPESDIGGSITTVRTRGCRERAKNEEAQEHVRILYVALTRAENAFYLVGKAGTNTGYVMMEDLPKRISFHPAFLDALRAGGAFDQKSFDALTKYDQLKSSLKLPDEVRKAGEIYEAAKALLEKKVIEPLQKKRDKALYDFLLQALSYYLGRFKAKATDLDFLSEVYATTFYPKLQKEKGIKTFKALVKDVTSMGEDIADDADISEAVLPQDEEKWTKRLLDFGQAILDWNVAGFAPLASFNQDERNPKKPHGKKVLIDNLLPVLAKVFDSIPYVAYESYENDGFKDDTEVFDVADFRGRKYIAKPTLPTLTVDDTPLTFEAVEAKRASKKSVDPDFRDEAAMERGTHLHRLLQLSKLDEKNLDFIADESEKNLILRCLRLDLLQKAKKGKAYPEYGYYDTDFDTTGFIDLLFFEEDGTCHIVDYKTYDIDDPAYVEQLHAYRRNVSRLFGVKESDIRLHLLSIKKAEVKDIA